MYSCIFVYVYSRSYVRYLIPEYHDVALPRHVLSGCVFHTRRGWCITSTLTGIPTVATTEGAWTSPGCRVDLGGFRGIPWPFKKMFYKLFWLVV